MREKVIDLMTYSLETWNGIGRFRMGENDKMLEQAKESAIAIVLNDGNGFYIGDRKKVINIIKELTWEEINLPYKYHAGRCDSPFYY